ncbi:MAG TPA: PP2C family protein-serine/threonine phosphatase [Bryobacteraceae bacterium]|nr:PP2C family protein-serine/threonine phosphatase [Bryobacteraceae bacterium]
MNFRAAKLRAKERRKYWQTVPLPALLWLALTAFLTFASVGLAADLSSGLRWPFWWAITRMVGFGLIVAVFIAAMIRVPKTRPIVLALFFLMLIGLPRIDLRFAANGTLLGPRFESVRWRLGTEGMILSFCAAAGWSIFVIFAGTQGVRHVRERTELELAEKVQRRLAPPLTIRTERYAIHGRSVPSSQMGGDLLDAVSDGESAMCYIADVAGHGIAAGVFMGMVKSAARTALLNPGPIEQLLTDLNRVLFEVKAGSSTYVTFACAQCRQDGKVEYALAGHGPILHYRARSKTVARLAMEQFPLGLFATAKFQSAEIDVEPGDILALMTDGLPETTNEADEEFGFDRIGDIVAQNAQDSLAALADRLFTEIRRHGVQTDDETLLLVRVQARA